jgi:hypothetical protein
MLTNRSTFINAVSILLGFCVYSVEFCKFLCKLLFLVPITIFERIFIRAMNFDFTYLGFLRCLWERKALVSSRLAAQ